MPKVRLEIDEIKIYRPKKKWKLYFVVVADHPTDNDKKVVAALPGHGPIKLAARHENAFQFDTDDEGSEGLYLMSRDMPSDRELNVHVYLRHTRQAVRNFGEILSDIESGIGADAMGIVSELASSASVPWLVIAKKAVPMVGEILKKIPDKDFGFVSLFERFGPEFETQTEIDREKDFSGNASLVYSWSVDEI